jgi:hypothetical protein
MILFWCLFPLTENCVLFEMGIGTKRTTRFWKRRDLIEKYIETGVTENA